MRLWLTKYFQNWLLCLYRETIAVECLKMFVSNLIMVFGGEYLRKPNSNDVEHFLQMGEARGFPGMMCSIDCMHRQWKKLSYSIEENVHEWSQRICNNFTKSSCFIWSMDMSCIFGVARSNNDKNILKRSPVFDELLQGHALKVNYTINRNNYNTSYYLNNGIYTFLKIYHIRKVRKENYFQNINKASEKTLSFWYATVLFRNYTRFFAFGTKQILRELWKHVT